MDKAKPIEPGCAVVMIGAPPADKIEGGLPEGIGEAIQYHPIYRCSTIRVIDCWECKFNGTYYLKAKYLVRVDDPDIQKQIENEREKVCG